MLKVFKQIKQKADKTFECGSNDPELAEMQVDKDFLSLYFDPEGQLGMVVLAIDPDNQFVVSVHLNPEQLSELSTLITNYLRNYNASTEASTDGRAESVSADSCSTKKLHTDCEEQGQPTL